MEVRGNMGIDIPLTASNAMQVQLKQATMAMGAVAGAAGHLMAGDAAGAGVSAMSGALNIAGMDYQTQRTGAPSPVCSSFANHAIVVSIEHPLVSGATPSAGYKHLHGYPCHKYRTLSGLSGFVQIDRRTDIQIAMTAEENRMLESLLTTGVFI